jgi:short-subunit dehydrogenase
MTTARARGLPSSEQRRLKERYGPCAVVTGASSGIGREIAMLLAASGLNLVLVARRAAAIDAMRLDNLHGILVRTLALDLAHPDSQQHLERSTADLDIGLLVAAAGFGSSGPALSADAAAESAMLRVNCLATLEQTLYFGRRFVDRGRGGVVLFGSLVGFQRTPWAANYAATKAYAQSLAEGLRMEWRDKGVDVLAVAPGPVHTGFAARAGMGFGTALQADVVAREILVALGRRGTVRPGWLSRLLGAGLATAPRSLRVRIMGNIMAGMAAPSAGKGGTRAER